MTKNKINTRLNSFRSIFFFITKFNNYQVKQMFKINFYILLIPFEKLEIVVTYFDLNCWQIKPKKFEDNFFNPETFLDYNNQEKY